MAVRVIWRVNTLLFQSSRRLIPKHYHELVTMTITNEKGLTETELNAYLDHIRFPKRWRSFEQEGRVNVDLLYALHIHHITSIPYENLGLHYTKVPRISIEPSKILQKALNGGRGGYCMEGNVLFNAVLRVIGFKAYLTGARIRLRKGNIPQGPWLGWQHCVNIVEFEDGSKWTSDVAFGGDGPIEPIPLQQNKIVKNLGSQELRLVYEPLQGSLTNQKWWIYQYRNHSEDENGWNSYYTFQEVEFFPTDFEVMNWFCSAKDDHFHRVIPIVVKFVANEERCDDRQVRLTSKDLIKPVIGKIMLAGNVIKRNLGGKTEVLIDCKNEKERIEGLQKYLQISFSSEQIQGIQGRISEIKDQS